MASFHDFTTAQLRQAVQIREQIEALQAKLDALLGGKATEFKPSDRGTKRTKAAGRRQGGAAPTWHLAHVRSPVDTLF